MRRRRLLALTLSLALAAAAGSRAIATADQLIDGGPVTPDPGFAHGAVPGGSCTTDTPYEQHIYGAVSRYDDLGCKRIEFSLGPITVKPGQNEALVVPTTIESPRYDGYIVRFKPDLQVAVNGQKTRTDVMHLHHATWLNLGASYGDGPFFAAGEEKTIATFPEGYGMKVKATDEWGLLYMVHNATTQVEEVWISYEIDYVPAAAAEADPDGAGPRTANILPVKPLWFDVQKHKIHEDAPSTSSNPVFHAQRGFGTVDAETGRLACRWPDQNCSRFDQYGGVTPQMGVDVDAPSAGPNSGPGEGEITGTEWTVPADLAGTLIGLGGHLHPGGLRVELDQIRAAERENIFVSDALYWDFDQTGAQEGIGRVGADVQSWNLSMTITGLPLEWAVDIKPGDKLSINAIYDTSVASWYEGMGIIVALVAPELQPGDHSVDVFDQAVSVSRGLPTNAITPPGPFYKATGFRPGSCTPNLDPTAGSLRLCARGQVSHGPVPESSHQGGCPASGCQGLPDKPGPIVTDITSQAFTYGVADQSVIGQTGIPRLVQGQEARFWSYDTAARIWHTFTRCALPCTGATGVAYPIADVDDPNESGAMDFDSGELGYGILTEPSKSQLGGSKPYDQQWLEDGLVWRFVPQDPGTYTFWCRIHPGMRGAFEVITPAEAANESPVGGFGGFGGLSSGGAAQPGTTALGLGQGLGLDLGLGIGGLR